MIVEKYKKCVFIFFISFHYILFSFSSLTFTIFNGLSLVFVTKTQYQFTQLNEILWSYFFWFYFFSRSFLLKLYSVFSNFSELMMTWELVGIKIYGIVYNLLEKLVKKILQTWVLFQFNWQVSQSNFHLSKMLV